VFFERMIAHPQSEIERVCRFLGYAGAPVWQEGVRDNVSEQRMRKSALRNAIVHNPLLAPLRRQLVPKAWRDRAKGLWQMREKPVLADAERARLEAVFDVDLAQLGGMMGVELNCANFKSTVRAAEMNWR
jgi:hypothetical protein